MIKKCAESPFLGGCQKLWFFSFFQTGNGFDVFFSVENRVQGPQTGPPLRGEWL